MLDEDNQFLESDNKKCIDEEKSNASIDKDPSPLIRPEVRQGVPWGYETNAERVAKQAEVQPRWCSIA
jgi:hypothetical protein